jgi:hypothetical protein
MAAQVQPAQTVLNQVLPFTVVEVVVVQEKKEYHDGVGTQMPKVVTAWQVLSKALLLNILAVEAVEAATVAVAIRDQADQLAG